MKNLGSQSDPKDLASVGLGISVASVGDLLKVAAVDAQGRPTEWAKAVAGTDYESPIAKKSISLSATWSGNGPYTQTVTLSGYTVTANSKVDIQPDSTALAQLITDGVSALYVENNSGTLTAYAVGAAPTAALTVQVTVTEVSA